MSTDDLPRFAAVLTAAIQSRGLSLERIRARLDAAGVPVSIATLSYWQSGRSLPTRSRSFHTLVELEKVLGVEPGHLTQHTHTADGRTRRELFEWQTVLPVRDLAMEIIDDLGIDMQGQMTRVAQTDQLTLRADRTEAVQDMRVVWRAERQGAHRWAVVSEQDSSSDSVPLVEAIFGCQIGEVVEVPERNLVVAELLAPRPLQRGELFNAEYRITYAPTSLPSFRTQRSVTDPVKVVSLGVTFDPAAVPARVWAAIAPTMYDDATETSSVALSGTEIQAVWTDARPGVYSLNWEWD